LTPVFNVIYPRFTALIVAGNTKELTNLYRLGTRLLSAILFPIATVAGLFAVDFVHLWTGNLDLSIKVAPIISLLLMGTAINGIMIFPYALQLANEEVQLPLRICIILIIFIIPTTIFLALNYGAIGAAAAWTLMNSVYLLMGSWLTHRLFLKEIGLKWLLWDVGVPLVFSLLVIRLAGEKIHNFGQTPIVNLAMAFGLVLLSILLSISTSPRLVVMLRNVFNNTNRSR
jgi:O-antigen/teichoic acid export membrane protein